ncbi:hypothetical protein V8C86DRAFT_2856960 [Haematococcus lacustris]
MWRTAWYPIFPLLVYASQMKHFGAWCLLVERNPRDIVNSSTMYLLHVLTIFVRIKDLRSQPTRTPAQQQELQELEEGPGSPHLRISALKQLHAGLQKAYQKALLPQDVDLLQIAVYKKTYQDLVRRVMGGDKICDPSLLDTCGAGTLLSREDMNDMMSNTLAVKTEKAATRRCLALLLWSGVARGDSVRQCKVQGISARPVKGIGPSACVKFTINYRSGKTTVSRALKFCWPWVAGITTPRTGRQHSTIPEMRSPLGHSWTWQLCTSSASCLL